MTKDDAHSFLREIKAWSPSKHERFIVLMGNFRSGHMSRIEVLSECFRVFEEKQDLFERFSAFLSVAPAAPAAEAAAAPAAPAAEAAAADAAAAASAAGTSAKWDGSSLLFRGMLVEMCNGRGYVYKRCDRCDTDRSKFALGRQGTSTQALKCRKCDNLSSRKCKQNKKK